MNILQKKIMKNFPTYLKNTWIKSSKLFINYCYRNWIPLSIYFISMTFLMIFQVKIPTNGDTYVYADSIRNFTGPVIHFGYYILGSIFFNLISFLNVSPVSSLGYLSAICGSFTVLFIYQISIILTNNNKLVSICASTILLFSGAFWFYSIHGEVYIPQLATISLSILLLLKKRPLLASLSFLIAVSITPTSVLAFPGLIYLLYYKCFTQKQKLFFVFPIVIPVLIILVWDIHKIIEIIDGVIYLPSIFINEPSVFNLLKEIIYDLLRVYIKSFNISIIFITFGFWQLFRENRKIWTLMIFFIFPFSAYILNLGLLSSDHLIITFLPLSYFSSYYLMKMITNLKLSIKSIVLVLSILFCIHGWFSYQFLIAPERESSIEYSNLIHSFNDVFENDAILVSDYGLGMGFWYLTKNEDNYYLQTGRPNKFIRLIDEQNRNKYQRLKEAFWININHFLDFFEAVNFMDIARDRPIYFIEKGVNHSKIVTYFMPEKIIKEHKQTETLHIRFTDFLKRNINNSWNYNKILGSREFYVYKITRK